MQTYVQYCGGFFTLSELEIIFNIFEETEWEESK